MRVSTQSKQISGGSGKFRVGRRDQAVSSDVTRCAEVFKGSIEGLTFVYCANKDR